MKNLLIKLGLWEDTIDLSKGNIDAQIYPDEHWAPFIEKAMKHYCLIHDRWFSDARGKLMHDRHRHKPTT